MDTLEKYGYSFQTKVLTSLITDRDFLVQNIDLIDSSYFSNKALKWLVDQTLFYFKETKQLPTLDVFKIQVSNITDELFKTEIVTTLKDSFKAVESTDLSKIKETVVEFCKHQEIAKAYINSTEDFKKGNYEEILKKFDTAIKKGQIAVDFGHNYIEDLEYRYTEQAKPERIPTGIKILDEVMNGGLPRGNFGIISAPSGGGKSWWLSKLGVNALKSGYKVLHYTLELDDIYTAWRYDSLLTGIPFDDLQFHQDDVSKQVLKYKNNKLFIKNFPMRSLSLFALEAHIEKHILAGLSPDLVILDYADLMKIDFTGVRDDKVLGELFADLRGLAQRFNFALWSADQINRENSEKDIIGNTGISSAYAKIFALDFNMTFSRKPKDKAQNVGRLHIAKSRLGTDGLTFPCKFDTYNALIEVYHEKTETGKKVKEEMKSDHEYEMEYARKQFERFEKRKESLF